MNPPDSDIGIEKMALSRTTSVDGTTAPGATAKKRLAYVSPLPPERSGISDYSSELLPALATHYQIDVIVDQTNIDDLWIIDNCTIRDYSWLLTNPEYYDRVLYHFGNSPFHQNMFALIEKAPGTVVLHDFYLAGALVNLELSGSHPRIWSQALYHCHGYPAIYDRFAEQDMASVVMRYPCNLSVIQNSIGTIVHSKNSLRLADEWYGMNSSARAVIPHIRDPRINPDKEAAREKLGISSDDFIVCAFGLLGPTKLNERLLDAWLGSALASKNSRCKLIFVGESYGGAYGSELDQRIRSRIHSKNVFITGWVDKFQFTQYLSAADLGVQLRTLTRGETSGTVLDCMNYGLATIVNANGSMSDLDDSAVWMLPDQFTDEELIDALETLWTDINQRDHLGKNARKLILEQHGPENCALSYRDAIEGFYGENEYGGDPPGIGLRQLLIHYDPANRKIADPLIDTHLLETWCVQVLRSASKSFRCELVRMTPDGFVYARKHALRLLECPEYALDDQEIDFKTGDVLLSFVNPCSFTEATANQYARFQHGGGTVLYAITGISGFTTRWMEALAEGDGILCPSKTSGIDMMHLFNAYSPLRAGTFTEVVAQSPLAENWAESDSSTRTIESIIRLLRNCSAFDYVGFATGRHADEPGNG